MNASGSARIERRPRRMTRFALMTAISALSISGCGGSGSGEPKSSTPTGTLAVAVTDVFGDPVSGARVYLSAAGQSEPAAGATDAGGRFSFAKIRAGSVEVSAVAPSGSSSAGFSWNSGGVRLPENGHLELAGTVRPTAQQPNCFGRLLRYGSTPVRLRQTVARSCSLFTCFSCCPSWAPSTST